MRFRLSKRIQLAHNQAAVLVRIKLIESGERAARRKHMHQRIQKRTYTEQWIEHVTCKSKSDTNAFSLRLLHRAFGLHHLDGRAHAEGGGRGAGPKSWLAVLGQDGEPTKGRLG